MAIEVHATAVPSGNPTGNFTIAIPATVEANDILIVCGSITDVGGSIGCTDDEGAGSWTQKAVEEDNDGGLTQAELFWKRASANTAGKTITVTTSGPTAAGYLVVYRGCTVNGDPIEAIANGDPNPASITTLTDGAMVCLDSFNGDSLTGPSSQSTATSPGALTERVEKITNTAGLDMACAHASALKATAGTTGAFSHTAATIGFGYALTPLQLPVINTQPSSTRARATETATFLVSATDPLGGSLTYQWQRDTGSGFSNIGGATSSSFTTEALDADDDGDLFRCVVTNADGSVTSNSASLGIDPTVNTELLGVWDPSLLPLNWF